MDDKSNLGMTELAAAAHKGLHFNELQFNMRLEFCWENAFGVKVYVDMWNNHAVKVNDPYNKFDLAPWVSYQGNYYMGIDGAIYNILTTLMY